MICGRENFQRLLWSLVLCVSGSGLASPNERTASSRLDDAACGDTGQCVVFEVVIKLNYSTTIPVVRQTTDVITINNTANPYGSTVRRQADSCTKQVHVPREVFQAIIGIMSSLTTDGLQPPALTPAQQTILLFYTTLMQQTLQFQCDAKDLGGAVAHG